MSRNNIGMAQKLSKKAKAAKKVRDKKTAMTARRRAMKAENQRKRRAAKKKGKSLKGKDYDHKTKRFTSVKITEVVLEEALKKKNNG